MPEFYKYAERQAGSQVNWAGIGIDLAETLAETEKIREQKRVAIDEATNNTLKELANAPKGSALDGNAFVSNYSDNATKSLLMQHRLLKSGRLDPKDYMLFNSNVKTGTEQLFNVQKEYQKQYAVKMERLNSNDPKNKSQQLEADFMAHLEAFGDLSKSKAIIDPTTGQVSVDIMEYDKNNVLQSTGRIQTIQDIYKGVAQQYNHFDVAGTSKTISDQLANVVMTTLNEGSISKKGQLITLDYALQDPNTAKAMNDYVDSYLDNPYNISSILTDNVGSYENEFTNDKSKKSSGNKIVWQVDKYGSLSTEFTPEQKKAAKEFLITATKAQIAQKEEVKQFQSAQTDAAELRIRQQNANTSATKTSKTGGEGDVITTKFPDWYERQWTNTIRKAPGSKDYDNPTNTAEQLNRAYSGLGYHFIPAKDGSNAVDIVVNVGANSPEGTVGAIVASVPLVSGARASIKKAILQDLAGTTNGTKRIQALDQAGTFDEVAPMKGGAAKNPTTNDPFGIR